MANGAMSSAVQFHIDTSQIGKGVTAAFLAIAAVGEALNFGLFAVGIQSQGAAIGVGVFLLILLGIGVLNGRGEEGVVILSDECLEVRTRRSKQSYSWQHIEGLAVKRFSELNPAARVWALIARIPGDYRIVQVRLRRSLRLNLVPGQFGTDIIGMPSLFAKTSRLYVADPDGLVNVASGFLDRRSASAP